MACICNPNIGEAKMGIFLGLTGPSSLLGLLTHLASSRQDRLCLQTKTKKPKQKRRADNTQEMTLGGYPLASKHACTHTHILEHSKEFTKQKLEWWCTLESPGDPIPVSYTMPAKPKSLTDVGAGFA